MLRGPVDKFLNVAVERPALDQIKVEVSGTVEDRLLSGLASNHREKRHFDSVLHHAVSAGLVRPLDPRKRHRLVLFGLDCALEVGGLALGHISTPTFDHAGGTVNFCLFAVGTAMTKPSM